MKKLLALGLSLCLLSEAQAQDPQLSQYYAAPLYLNPAFTGIHDYDCRKLPASRIRYIGNFRSQWNGTHTTYMGSIDGRNKKGNWGFGALVFQDVQDMSSASAPPLKTFQGAGLVSYQLGITGSWRLHSGVQLAYMQQTFDPSNYTFPDQYRIPGRLSPTNETLRGAGAAAAAPSASAGMLIFNSDFYLGGAVHHINQPNLTVVGGSPYRYPMKVDVHTGYRIPFKRSKGFAKRGSEKSITPVIHFKRQGNAQQLDVGTYLNYEPLVFGAWYRGLPVERTPSGRLQQDAVVLLAAVRAPTDYGLFKIGLSYDFPVSYGAVNAGRTFEFSLAYQFIDERCRKRISYRAIPCPGI